MATLQQLIRYKDIILFRTQAGIKSEARQNYLGYIWFLLEPVMSTAVLYVVWTQISGNKGPREVLFILLGMVIWQWFDSSVMAGATSIKMKFHVLNQFALPKYLFPVVTVLVNTWKFLWVFLLILVISLFIIGAPGPAYLWLLPVMFVQLLLIVAVTMTVSIIVTLMNDFLVVVSSVMRLLFFVSGIFFTVDKVPENLRDWFYLNPIAVLMESYRKIILDGVAPNGPLLLRAFATTLLLAVLGFALNARYDKKLLKLINA